MSKISICWASDIHLNFLTDVEVDSLGYIQKVLSEQKVREFCENILVRSPEAVIITGDITEAPYLEVHFGWLEKFLSPTPVYYVLGNHDFYRGSIDSVRKFCKDHDGKNGNMHWLPTCNVIELTEDIALVGHDGWYDGQYANWFANGVVEMADYILIAEFREHFLASQSSMVGDSRLKIFGVMQRLANECSLHIKEHLTKACEKYKTIIFATHVPPWPENSVYNGRISDWRWLPNFSSKLAGDALLEVASKNPNNNFIVLCGHSHGDAIYRPLPNIESHTRFSQYGYPEKSIKIINL